MPALLRPDLVAHLELLARARGLRQRASDVMDRALHLRRRSAELLSVCSECRRPPPPLPAEAAEDVETLGWLRAQVREMLAQGWTRAELADIGIRDGLLSELGLRWPEPG
jgi:hypothetical protein